MKKLCIVVILGMFIAVGCASVQVKAPKEPIKVDISMRLDIYQHVQEDIDAIEDIVSGSAGGHSMLDIMVGTAYAQDLSDELKEAALRRKARYDRLMSLEAAGVIGENRSGLVTVRAPGDGSERAIAAEENSDRMIIYKGIAAKNGVPVSEIQNIYAERLQASAPSGTPIEADNGAWTRK